MIGLAHYKIKSYMYNGDKPINPINNVFSSCGNNDRET